MMQSMLFVQDVNQCSSFVVSDFVAQHDASKEKAKGKDPEEEEGVKTDH